MWMMMSQKPNRERIPYRKVNGILILDKPLGLSSNHALQRARRIFAAEKAGHGGSLDVLASGLLPIFFGEATKFSQFLLNADKRYLTTGQLGIKTATGDAEGEIISQCEHVEVSLDQLQTVIEQFLGETAQVPSMYSALKFHGKPLYELARKGIEVERQARNIVIKQLQLINFQDNEMTLDVCCSKGTYIRNLVEDIGEKLGCGAYVKSLRRLQAGDFKAEQMITLEELAAIFEASSYAGLDPYLLKMDTVLQHFPALYLSPESVKKIQCGQVITDDYQQNEMTQNCFRVYDQHKNFLGLAEVRTDGKLYAKRLLNTQSE